MTLEDVAAIDKDFLNCEDVAPYLGTGGQDIRDQCKIDPSKLGFPVIVCGHRVKIPKEGFIHFIKYGRAI